LLKNIIKYKKNNGFSLIEVVIAFSMMLIGFVAMLSLAGFLIKSNSLSRGLSQARFLAEQQSERLRSLEWRSAALDDDGDTTDLDDTTAPDYQDSTVLRNMHYKMMWNIADDFPRAGVKTIKIHILWTYSGLEKHISFTTYKGESRR
jgi:Tfp pilus assembly protein PilV